jgi:hypothetical protein
VFSEHDRHHRQVPGVLGGVFEPGSIDERRASDHTLQAIDLPEERYLLLESV